ncbi:MAG: glycoside hydrolase family 3 N-terminal domain-containing protein [Thermoanaerobaculia bacterium]
MSASRFVVGLEGAELTERERALFGASPPLGYILLARNMESAPQTADLIAELRALTEPDGPTPLLFVDQEGGTVDRLGPILGASFASPRRCATAGTDRVHENAYLMGRAARMLGFDVDFAPAVDLGQPGTGEVILPGRTFGFHSEDVVVAGMMFLHGLTRAGIASCLKHFPGLGRGAVDSHLERPIVDAHDVDLMVTDVAPFTRLARIADGIMVGHASYPGFTKDSTPASLSPVIHQILRGPVGFSGVVYSDDLLMGALEGTVPERAARAAAAGCDVLVMSKGFDAYEDAIAAVAALAETREGNRPTEMRIAALRALCLAAPRPAFDLDAWEQLGQEVALFTEMLDKPRPRRVPEDEDAGMEPIDPIEPIE